MRRVFMAVIVLTWGAVAGVSADEPALPTVSNLEQAFDYEAFGASIVGVSLFALLVAFGLGGTLILAKKAYRFVIVDAFRDKGQRVGSFGHRRNIVHFLRNR